jgi:PAS domain S-box-containing protein
LAIGLAGILATALILGLPAPAVAALAAVCIGLSLARDRLRSVGRQRAARAEPRAAMSDVDLVQLAARWQAWIDRRFPLVLRGDGAGRPLTLEDRTGARAKLDAAQWVGGSFEASLEREHRAALRTWLQRAQAGDPPGEPLEVLAHGVAAARWFELWLRLVEGDGPPEIDGIGRDITERRESELEREVQAAIEGEWFRNASLDVALLRVLRSLAQAMFCSYVELWWHDDRSGLLHAGECWHAGGDELDAFARTFRNRSFAKGVGLAGRTWADAAPLRIEHLVNDADARCARLAKDGPFASGVGIPIRIGDRVLGVAVLLSASRPMAPAAEERLDRIAVQLGRLVDRKRSERAVSGSEARKNAMIESALDCVISIDAHGRIVEFNPAAERTFGRARGDVLGKEMVDLLVPEDYRERHLEAFRRCLGPGGGRPGGRRLELEGLRGDGSRFPLEISVTSIRVGDTPSFTAYLRDITDRKELDRLKDELVSTVSHELRTPLTSMRGFVELLLEREFPPEEQRQFLGIVDTEIKRLGKLIDDFLDLQRLEAGKLDYVFERQSLRPLIEEAVRMFEHTSAKHRYVLALDDGELPVSVDADRMRQTLRNLISNATKYSPDGGTVTIGAEIRDGSVRVSIRDQGIGMDAATQKKLFTRFYRADSTATRRIGGTGLGLALVKEIVEAHGGTVGVKSRPGEGSEFWFALPVAGGGD